MDQQTILEGYSDTEKGAYLSAIASLATADRQASQEELEHLAGLAQTAELSDEQLQKVEKAATEVSGDELQRSLDILKKSELKYSLVADLIAFGKSDSNYTTEEQQKVQQIGEYLGVTPQQFSLLDQFADNAAQNSQEGNEEGMLGIGSMQDKMKSAGINTSGLLKGLLALAAPIILSKVLNRGRQGGGGGLGGALGGGLGGMLGGGGLGSVIGMLNGGKGFGGAGGLLGKILGGKF